MEIRAEVLIINDIVNGEFVEITAEFARVLADTFQDSFDFTVILREKGGDAAGFAEVKCLEDNAFGFEDPISQGIRPSGYPGLGNPEIRVSGTNFLFGYPDSRIS